MRLLVTDAAAQPPRQATAWLIMTFGKMEKTLSRLVDVLSELVALLSSDGDAHWSQWMSSAKERISRGDSSGIQKLLEAYGGMGSFNDLIVGQRMNEGRFEWKPGAQALNGRLEALRNEAYELAMKLRTK